VEDAEGVPFGVEEIALPPDARPWEARPAAEVGDFYGHLIEVSDFPFEQTKAFVPCFGGGVSAGRFKRPPLSPFLFASSQEGRVHAAHGFIHNLDGRSGCSPL